MSAEQLSPGWRRVKFGDVVRDVKNTTKDPAVDGLERVVGLDHLDPESLPLRRWDELADLPDGTSFTRTFKAGQVLFGKRRAYQRKVAVPDFDGICSGDILVFEPASPDLLPELLPYLVQSDGFFDHALGTSAGSLSPRTKWQELAKYEFALPPLDEQKRIVELVAASDSARLSYDKVAACAAAGVDAARQELISEDYQADTRRLGEVTSIALGRVYPSSEYTKAGMRLLRPGNIAPGGRLSWTSSIYLPAEWATESGSVLVGPGDVIMNLTAQTLDDGFLGRVCLADVGDEAIMNQRIARLRSEEVLPAYLCAVLQHGRFRRHVAMSAKGSKIKHLYERDFADFPVPVPSLARQNEVISRLQHLDSVSRLAESTMRRSAGLRRALMESSLMGTGA